MQAVPRGREMLYQLASRPTSLDDVRRYLDRLSRSWDDALARFKAFAEQEDDG